MGSIHYNIRKELALRILKATLELANEDTIVSLLRALKPEAKFKITDKTDSEFVINDFEDFENVL